ncbi:thiosulfate sulfurtransferase-like [Ostrea edulis]|uniref:thiosulfate sulfurtransferase-like n=1 Tax=Ostrea edulis TaxID=37623 RepID=UPI0024AF769C|nr:thiosulfate sulfurtransferase-like [Ostrea edulis]
MRLQKLRPCVRACVAQRSLPAQRPMRVLGLVLKSPKYSKLHHTFIKRNFQTLVSSSWLRNQLAASSKLSSELRLLDASWQSNGQGYQQLYKQAHIPHAVYFDLYKCCTGTKEIPLNLPEPECWTQYIQSLGVSSDTHVVVYDGQNMRLALRTWWLFRLYGHENISVLDGGLIKWADDGYEITVHEPQVEPGNFQCELNKSLVRDYEDMQKNAKTQKEQVVDVREASSFVGGVEETPPESRNGHIPGSLNIPYNLFFNEDMTFKSKEELEDLFEDAGVDLEKPIVSSCLLGITGCAINVASHMFGKKDTALYYGSWNEWRLRADASECETGPPRQRG